MRKRPKPRPVMMSCTRCTSACHVREGCRTARAARAPASRRESWDVRDDDCVTSGRAASGRAASTSGHAEVARGIERAALVPYLGVRRLKLRVRE
eukprot:3724567-Prymnesium_polylepis.1